MRHHPHKHRKQNGFVVTVELIFIVTILVIGLVAGWIQVRNAVIAELSDVAEGVGALNQSYSYPGTMDAPSSAITDGSQFLDDLDVGAGFGDTGAGDAENSITSVILPPADTEAASFGP